MIRISFALTICLCAVVAESSFAQQTSKDADSIISRFVDSVGGEELIGSVQSIKIKDECIIKSKAGTAVTGSDYIRFESQWLLTQVDGSLYGFDGKRWWHRTGGGKIRWLDDNRYPHSPLYCWPTYVQHVLDFPGKFRFEGETRLDGKLAYRLSAVLDKPEPSGRVRLAPGSFVFDAGTGFLVQVVSEWGECTIGDYRDIDGVMIPFKFNVKHRFADISQTTEITRLLVEVNPKLDKSLLTPPNEQN